MLGAHSHWKELWRALVGGILAMPLPPVSQLCPNWFSGDQRVPCAPRMWSISHTPTLKMLAAHFHQLDPGQWSFIKKTPTCSMTNVLLHFLLSSEPVVGKKIERSTGTLPQSSKFHAKQVLAKHCKWVLVKGVAWPGTGRQSNMQGKPGGNFQKDPIFTFISVMHSAKPQTLSFHFVLPLCPTHFSSKRQLYICVRIGGYFVHPLTSEWKGSLCTLTWCVPVENL